MMNHETISLQDCVCQGKGSIVSDMGGEKVMLSVQNGKYYNLGEIGGKIWDSIENPISIGQLVSTLMREYDVDQNECEQHVISFLAHMAGEGLVQVGADGHRE
ncbi:lasso peptide biosynthesis PqqD family chaperone [Paenibacillus chondroitinus]|uniref:Lasso peptide biosynthesis PqqD family chaperone n=1 Tax=Paenibacillus chondroitinus TaxID=59842 RepID=A0ABU6DIT8_9BACL|nr:MULTISPECIES: lasso peptide biosynthesis PqqD family chaperone [Paenibacillus]MCY9660242.1 lasso peptide biosynthesis PqqD family chaperone [Paenibacillus anseongense]MEB4797668.1 lasso peptide biosynthesis PqqD family chaperone [Paenibacillus chondroitinus]